MEFSCQKGTKLLNFGANIQIVNKQLKSADKSKQKAENQLTKSKQTAVKSKQIAENQLTKVKKQLKSTDKSKQKQPKKAHNAF